MKTATILSALLAVVAAVPLDKRRIYYTTTTTEVIEYVSITTTVYVDSLPTTSAQGGAFYNVPQGQPAVLTSSGPAPVSTSSAPPSAAPPAIPTTSAYVAPPAPAPPAPVAAPPSVYVAPPPAPSAPAPPPPPPPPAPPAPVAAQAASNPSGPVYSGDITFYDVGMGSCGRYNTADQPVVALAVSMMNNPANPNNNPLCGKTITISYGGTTHQATVVDTCHDCSRESIDLSTSLFKLVAPGGDGRVHGVQWWFN